MDRRPPTSLKVGLACSQAMYERCIRPDNLERLEKLGEFEFAPFTVPFSVSGDPQADPVESERLAGWAADRDVLVVGPGAPRLTGELLSRLPQLRFIGEIEGDRFAARIDVAAAAQRGIVVSDTTQGSSYPVAEWTLALMMIGLRNAGELFRRMIEGQIVATPDKHAQIGYRRGELRGKTVGLIGVGYIGRQLLTFLEPFGVRVLACDPHAPRVLADIYDIDFTDLDTMMSRADIVVCTVPLTRETNRMIGERELGLLREGAVLVNVGRGAVIDPDALIARLRRGDITAALDVVEPDVLPPDSPLRAMRNLFISPHIAGSTADCGPRFVALMVDEIERWRDGLELRHRLVPRELGP